MSADNDNRLNMPSDDEETELEPSIFIVIGQISKQNGQPKSPVHVLLKAPDDDYAVRETLNALAREGYAQAELDQVGILDGFPDEEPHASAMEGVLKGEVAIIVFD